MQSSKVISLTHPSLHLFHQTIDSFTWNIIIRAHNNNNNNNLPITIFHKMRCHQVSPDFHTFPFLLQTLKNPSHFRQGQNIHAQLVVFGLINDPFAQTSLVNMYSICSHLGFAQQVFDEIFRPDLPSWNSILNANVKSRLLDVARNLFDRMPERNVISWSCMMDGYVRQGECRKALDLFREMQNLGKDGIVPNEFTVSIVLSACGQLGSLEYGKWTHAYIDNNEMKIDVVLGTSLIDMYAKCGSIEKAKRVFEDLGTNKDVTAWSAMISALAMHGYGKECLLLFSEMTKNGVRPNAITFMGVLCGCVHMGLVDEGELYFQKMKTEFGITPSVHHYGCLIDLYGRAGLIDKAWDTINTMPMDPDVLIWGAFLSGFRVHGDIKKCEVALEKLIELDPTNSGAYVLLSNIYAKAGKWKDVRSLRNIMDEKGIKKVPGCSTVEIGGVIHEFFVGDESHEETREIYLMLEEIMKKLKMEGYIGNITDVLLDLDEEEKEMALSVHSEKLAVAFAILKTKAGSTIHIVKNLRICGDCHVAIKMISRIFSREIIVRDCNRFHRFADGECSCNDYW